MIWKIIAIVFWSLVGLIGFCKCIDGDESKTLTGIIYIIISLAFLTGIAIGVQTVNHMTAKLIVSIKEVNGIAQIVYYCKERRRIYRKSFADTVREFRDAYRKANKK